MINIIAEIILERKKKKKKDETENIAVGFQSDF